MRYSTAFSTLLLLAAMAATGCDDNTVVTPTEPSPVTISETFSDSLNANGLRIHAFTVSRAGTVSAQLATLSDPAATVGLSIGTWNGAACQIVIVNPAAVLNTTVTGTAQAIGEFCVMLNDVGKLTTSVDYSVTVTHF